jgi:hypothetical protein
MWVLINSDILFTTYLLRQLPADLRELAAACGRNAIPVILPLTSLLEFRYKQELQAKAERRALRGAFATLDRYGIGHDEFDLETGVAPRDLVELLNAAGAVVQVEEPTLLDFQEAHRRACCHEPPGAENAKSDEMRDLVIWVQAARLSREHGGLLLLSKDSVHVGELGDSEARDAGMTRFNSIEDALGFLELESPAGRLAQALLAEAAPALRAAGLPLAHSVQVSFVRNPSFVQAGFGISSARFLVKVGATEARSLRAQVVMRRDSSRTHIAISNASLDDVPIDDLEAEFNTPATSLANSAEYEERLAALRLVLGGSRELTNG